MTIYSKYLRICLYNVLFLNSHAKQGVIQIIENIYLRRNSMVIKIFAPFFSLRTNLNIQIANNNE